VLRTVIFIILVTVLVTALYGFFAVGHSFPSLGVALLTGAINGLLNRAGNRARAPRVAGAIVLFIGLGISHQFAGVPTTGPHRLVFDAQYFAVFLVAMLVVRALVRAWQPPGPPTTVR
jgi:hypothetical protein